MPCLDSNRTLHAFHVPTDYTTEAPCTRESAILDTRPMRARVWRTADTIISLYRSWQPHHHCFSEDGAGFHVRLLVDRPFIWFPNRRADIGRDYLGVGGASIS
jgi:hypothetical protein